MLDCRRRVCPLCVRLLQDSATILPSRGRKQNLPTKRQNRKRDSLSWSLLYQHDCFLEHFTGRSVFAVNRLRSLFNSHKSVALAVLAFPLAGLAEDPIVVHYSDPSLARMEAQIGVTPAQRERFEDIIVKYRDPFSAQAPEDTGQGKIRSGGSGHRGGAREIGQGETRAASRGGKANASLKELDELATILTPSQLQRFKDLNSRKKERKRSGFPAL